MKYFTTIHAAATQNLQLFTRFQNLQKTTSFQNLHTFTSFRQQPTPQQRSERRGNAQNAAATLRTPRQRSERRGNAQRTT
jgi:hypothetical protein